MSIKNVKLKIKNYLLLLLLTHLLTYSLTHCLFGEGFKIERVKPKIITPNDDHKNDMLIVAYEYTESTVSGRILTINGSYIADMLNNDDRITWDGKDGGSVVPSGIYIYQIEAEGQIFNGTVVVAK